MSGLKRLVHEIHRRSLWQVLGIYLLAAWIGFQVIQTLTEGLGLPDWFPPLALLLLIVGLPIVLATAFVQEGVRPVGRGDPTLLPGGGAASGDQRAARQERATVGRLFTWRNAIAGGVAAFALWGVIAAGYLVFHGPGVGAAGAANVEVSPDRIAVLPFSHRGGEETAYLGEGIVDLLSATLDGAGELRAVDARSVIRAVKRQGGGAPDPPAGQAIAEELGAGQYVLGDIVEAGGRLRINAFLHQSPASPESEPKAAVEGTPDEIFQLVDNLTAQLLVGTVEGPAARRATRGHLVYVVNLPFLVAVLRCRGDNHGDSWAPRPSSRRCRGRPARAHRGLESLGGRRQEVGAGARASSGRPGARQRLRAATG